MEEAVHLFESFKTIFYFKKYGLGKTAIGWSKVWKVLK
jgi:hypothetical protein